MEDYMNDLKTKKPKPVVTSFRLPENILRVVDEFCEASDITRSQLLRKCLKNYEPIKYQITDQPSPLPTEQPSSESLVKGR
jgi:hypothetical protein